ncbi:MAG: hypothetical protein Q9167_004093 [Letrouitia subvulpina]
MSRFVPQILFVDAYDSFSNNIISLLEKKLQVSVTKIKIDQTIPDLHIFLAQYQAVVVGPGPGHPNRPEDVGLINFLWKLEEGHLLPVMGICLGFQSLVLNFGGQVKPLPEPRHGIPRIITSSEKSIFRGIGYFESVQYHSLYASWGDDDLDLEPLAWDRKEDNRTSSDIPGHKVNPKSILMAVKHKHKPFYGIQFHPESICSSKTAQEIMAAWWTDAQSWNANQRQKSAYTMANASFRQVSELNSSLRQTVYSLDLTQALETAMTDSVSSSRSPSVFSEDGSEFPDQGSPPSTVSLRSSMLSMNEAGFPATSTQLLSEVLPQHSLTVPQIYEIVRTTGSDAVVFDSEMHQREVVGTHSIIGVIEPDNMKLEYKIGSDEVRQVQNGKSISIPLYEYDCDIFCYLQNFMRDYKVDQGDARVPFWGGLMGFISYEACLETVDINAPNGASGKPDICFIFVKRSIVVDHPNHQIHVQSIKPHDSNWISSTATALTDFPSSSLLSPLPLNVQPQISYPDALDYQRKIQLCQSSIRSGDSYELCLTTSATVRALHTPDPYPLFLHLRSLNPAPFSAYLRLGKMTLLSSSPERFMSWSRPRPCPSNNPPATKSTVQFRPIKGTAKRYPHGPNKPAISLNQAEKLLSTPKERAENLMIVDLIRHDLHEITPYVTVPKLMVVEEYATVFQLVTVVEGQLIQQPFRSDYDDNKTFNPGHGKKKRRLLTDENNKNGLSVLASSLPPGSMTGAPKRRSCALLHELEKRPRGVYSGVVGYMDVGGGGDFSVCIRSAVRWEGENSSHRSERVEGENQKTEDGGQKRDEWHIGAGGAITALSDAKAEWEEMEAKLGSTIRLFS